MPPSRVANLWWTRHVAMRPSTGVIGASEEQLYGCVEWKSICVEPCVWNHAGTCVRVCMWILAPPCVLHERNGHGKN
eukprot:6372669-Pyramimonas_sp.AAC.1